MQVQFETWINSAEGASAKKAIEHGRVDLALQLAYAGGALAASTSLGDKLGKALALPLTSLK